MTTNTAAQTKTIIKRALAGLATLSVAALLLGSVSVMLPASVHAQDKKDDKNAQDTGPQQLDPKTDIDTCKPGAQYCTPFTSTDDNGAKPCEQATCYYAKYINPLVNTLSAMVGVAVLISMLYGGIQYTTAGGDSAKVSAAKQRIFKSLVTLFFFFSLWAFLSWLLPGGIGG